MKLSKPMMDALRKLNAGNSTCPGDFRTMEALRRRGLADRYTTIAIRAEYVTKDDSAVQYRATARKPHLVHEWYYTSAGLDAER